MALLEADELVGEGLRGDECRVAGLVEAVRVLLRLQLLELLVERLLRLSGPIEGGLRILEAASLVRVVPGQAGLVLAG